MDKNIDSNPCEKLTGVGAGWCLLYSGYGAAWGSVTKLYQFLEVSLHGGPVAGLSLCGGMKRILNVYSGKEIEVGKTFGGRNVLWVVPWGSVWDGVPAFRKRRRGFVSSADAELGSWLVPHDTHQRPAACGLVRNGAAGMASVRALTAFYQQHTLWW